MRTLRPATNLVLGCLAALALLATLDFPWVCPAVSDPVVTDGPVERAAFQVAHVFEHADGAASGTIALGTWRLVLVVIVSVLILLAGMAAVPALRNGVRDPLRMVAL